MKNRNSVLQSREEVASASAKALLSKESERTPPWGASQCGPARYKHHRETAEGLYSAAFWGFPYPILNIGFGHLRKPHPHPILPFVKSCGSDGPRASFKFSINKHRLGTAAPPWGVTPQCPERVSSIGTVESHRLWKGLVVQVPGGSLLKKIMDSAT